MKKAETPLERLEELLPEFKKNLLATDYKLLKDICDDLKQGNPDTESLTKNFADHLNAVANSNQYYLSNLKYKQSLETAIGILSQI